jgi:hypothetical protein
VDGGLRKWSIYLYRSSVSGTCKGHLHWGTRECIKEGSGDGHLSPMGPLWEAWKGVTLTRGLCVEKGSGDRYFCS